MQRKPIIDDFAARARALKKKVSEKLKEAAGRRSEAPHQPGGENRSPDTGPKPP